MSDLRVAEWALISFGMICNADDIGMFDFGFGLGSGRVR